MNRRLTIISLVLLLVLTCSAFPPAFGWWDDGHRWINLTAAGILPADVPEFLRKAAVRLAFLGPEPDRWRDNRQIYSALREFNGPDHFIDIDKSEEFKSLPDDRYKYSDWLRLQGKSPNQVGFLPYACLEYYEKLQILFRLWRDPQQAAEREQIEQNIIYCAGVMGHYVADGANPLHTTVHYNGWTTSWNPETFSREQLHGRFEGEFVRARIQPDGLKAMVQPARRLPDPFSNIMTYLFESYGKVEELYRLDKVSRWAANNDNPECRKFVEGRLAAGAQMLANLWYTAWLDSAPAQR